MKKIIFTFILLLNFYVTHGQEVQKISKNGVSIEYPNDWVIRDFEGYLLLVSEVAGEELTFMSTFDIQIDSTYSDTKLFCKNYEKKMKKSEFFKEFKINSKKNIEYKGLNAIEYNCTANVQYLPIEWKSIIFQKEGKIYKLTTTSTIGKSYLLKDKTDMIFESFTFI